MVGGFRATISIQKQWTQRWVWVDGGWWVKGSRKPDKSARVGVDADGGGPPLEAQGTIGLEVGRDGGGTPSDNPENRGPQRP